MDNPKENIKPNNGKELTEVEERQSPPPMVSDALAAATSLRLENERMEKNIKQLQELQAFQALGGRTQGAPQVEAPKEISPQEYSKLVLAGKLPVKK